MSAVDSFLRSLAEERGRDAAVLAELDAASADAVTRLAADTVRGLRVRALLADGVVFIDHGTCHIDRTRLHAVQRRRMLVRFSMFGGMCLLILLPIVFALMASRSR